jgi:hypothetical protein
MTCIFTDVSEDGAVSVFGAEDRGSRFIQNVGK